jgi:glyoxylase-like metal-dependent hydrolase (beta-lactamase superfamily II)
LRRADCSVRSEGTHSFQERTLPSVTFGEERTIELGGVTVQLFYFGPAHTDADAVVYFPDLKVIAVGDCAGKNFSTRL